LVNKGDRGININVFDNVYITSNQYEYQLYQMKKVKNKEGDLIDSKSVVGHYSTLNYLLQNFLDIYLKNFSNAQTIEELKDDVKKVYQLIEKVKLR